MRSKLIVAVLLGILTSNMIFGKEPGERILEQVLTIGDEAEGIIFQWVGLTTDDDGNIYITDLKDFNIKKFNCRGVFLRKTGNKGEGPGEFKSPGLIRFHGGRLYVGQIQAPGIQIFDLDLNYRETIPLKTPASNFQVMDQGRIAFSTLYSGMIKIHDFTGVKITSIPFAPDGEMLINSIIFTFHDSFVYLAFRWQDRIRSMDMSGRIAWESHLFGQKEIHTVKVRGFRLPDTICFKSLAVSSAGLIYVLGGDLSRHRSRDIYVLSQEGVVLDTLTLSDPTHMIHIDSMNALYARADYGTRIKKYRISVLDD